MVTPLPSINGVTGNCIRVPSRCAPRIHGSKINYKYIIHPFYKKSKKNRSTKFDTIKFTPTLRHSALTVLIHCLYLPQAAETKPSGG